MKKLITYLKTLWSWVSGSQRKKIGVTLGEATIEHPFSTYSAPFGTCWQPSGKLHSVVRCAAMLVMLFSIGSGNVWGAEEVYKETIFNSTNNSGKAGSYSNSWYNTTNSFKVNITNANNNNNGWEYVKIGSKSSALTGTFITDAIIDQKITKVSINIGAITTASVTSIKLYTSTNKSSWTERGTFTKATGWKDVTIAAANQANNYYYKIEAVCAKASSNGPLQINGIRFYKEAGGTTYTVTYNKNNASASGTMTDSNSPYASGATVTVLANGFTAPSGKVFSHWDTKADDSGTDYAPGATFSISGNTTLYAQWATAYTITYNLNGGTGTTPTESAKASGATFTLHDGTTGITPPTKKVFSKWRDQDGTDYEGGDTYTMPSKNVTLTAQWVAAGGDYVLVEDAGDIGPGKYLIVYNNTYALNTHYGNVNANTYATYTDISTYYNSKKITSNATTDALAYTVAATTNGYSISHIESGTTYYLGNSSNSTGSTLRWDNPFTTSQDEWTLGVNSIVSARNSIYAIRWNNNSGQYRFAIYNTTGQQAVQLFKQVEACEEAELAYSPATETKTYGDAAFTKTLTNSHSVAVTYALSDVSPAGCVSINTTTGQVTINGAGSATVTASSAKQTVSDVDYCADEASYTLTVNKASISPTLTYTPNSVAVGENTSAPTVGANPGSGGVTYAITSATPAGCATIDAGTGVVSGVAVGSVTVTATVAATANYNGGTATATVTINAAAYFPNNKTVFIQGESSSAWDASACVKAWFNASGAGGAAQTTYWLFDATDGDAGKKLYATIVPASGDLNQVTLQRFASNCSDFWNNNGTLTKASDGGSNTFRSTGSGTSNVAWNGTGMTLDLKGDPNSWGSSLGTFADQGNGVWTATYNNYAPANAAGESQEFKISTNYNGWIGNTGSNNNATLDGMHVGSTYDVTATLDIKDHSLEMSKTFVKGTVHFNLQGHGSAISDLMNVAAGSKISAPSAPSATGWDFGGWYKEPACTNAWNFGSDVVNETMTLYAKWTKHNYTITSTLNHCSSSPAIPSSYEYTGSAASLSYTITPSSGYRLPTEITVSGTTYTWNPATGALVLTGIITNNVTITISAVQTHTVDWYVGGSAPANKIGDDGQTTVVDHGGKISDFPAHDPDGSACDKTFVGWTNTSSYVHGTSPLFNDVAGSPTINADASFYAVFAEVNVATGYTYIGDEGMLETGETYIFVSSKSTGSAYALKSSDLPQNNTSGVKGTAVSVTVATGIKVSAENSDLEFTCSTHTEGEMDVLVLGSSANTLRINGNGIGYGDARAYYDNTGLYGWNNSGNTFYDVYYNSTSTKFEARSSASGRVYAYKKGGTTYTGYTINCADCGTSVTPTYTAAPTGGTVSVTKSAAAVASGSTVKTCTSVDLTVTITPASHYTLTGFTATGLSTGTATISPATNTVLPTTSAQTFTVTVSASATGTLNLTPVLTEDAHKVISWVVHGSSASIADGHGTTWVYSGENLTAIPTAPDAPTGCDDKVFVGWSENDGGATEEDASYYDDRFTTLGEAPTGITTDKTFTAVFATPAAGLGGTVMWDEPFDGDAGDQPSSPTSGATVYGSASIAYNCASTTYCKLYTDNLASGGAAAPELLIPKSSRSEAFEVTGIPTAGQTELTLTYMAKDALSVTTGTSGVTVGDASADGKLYTRTITIDQSGLGVATFGLTFAKSTDSNSRLDDIHLEVPGSSSMSGYVTTCEDTWTVTYYKNTEDAVTNLPSPTGISKSTGSGTLSSKVPVRYGYTFDGWATSAGGSVAYAAGAAVSSVSADMDLYAKWSVTPVTEINLSKTSLDKYVGDPSVTLSVLSVLPDGASTSVNWSSSNTSVATVSASGEVNFLAVGTATITATSTVTNTTTATCVVTVWAKPTATFLDNMHGLTVDENSVALSSYNLEAAAGTAVVFPTLANQIAGSGTCEDEHYIFVGWTTSDNNDDPEDHLVSSYTLTNGDAITYYAVWADGVSGTTYVKLTDNSFSTSKHYVIGAVHPDNGTTYYFNSCAKTDKDNSWGYVTADLASDTPIEFTLSGTASALVATTTESTSRYLKPTSTNEFHMSSISQTIMLKSDGKIYSTDETRRLLLNKSQPGLRWYGKGAVSGTSNAYFYEVVAGGEVNYRTSCCADKVPAPTVTATQTSVSVTLNWNDLSGSGATGYEVSWNDGAWTSPSGTRTHSVSGLTPNTTYTWKVRATYTTPKCGADIASGSTTTNQVYHVTYAGGSGTGTCNATGSTTDATAYEAGATVTLKANGFTLVGHTFDAWTEDDEDITISSNQFTMPEHDVVITATWTPKVDKFYDRMHDGTDASHGGIADGDGKYYITREGCSYTVPSLTDNTSGATACHTKHYVLMGWTAESHLNSDGTLKTGHEGYVYTGGGTQTATGATYYAVWAEVEE